VLDDHGAGAGDLATDGEALDEPQHDEHRGREHTDRLVRGQERHEERRDAHHQHAQHEDVLATVLVAPVAQRERAERAGHVPDAERREGGDDADGRVPLREEDRREHERRGLGVDEEVVVLQRAADPPAGGGLPRGAFHVFSFEAVHDAHRCATCGMGRG
jgi:hypothetical protein